MAVVYAPLPELKRGIFLDIAEPRVI